MARAARKKRQITPEDLLRLKLAGAPRLSPEGDRIVFSVKTFGDKNEMNSNLWMAEVDGTATRRFTGGGKDAAPAWSPCGTCVAFINGREKGRPQIALISAEGGEARTLTCFPEGSLANFRWSPDGRTIAVAFREQDPDWTKQAVEQREGCGASDPPRVLDDPWYRLDGDGYFNGQRFMLYIVDVETGEHTLLYGKDKIGVTAYDFSPDSKEIVVITNRDKYAFARSWPAELVRVDTRNGKLKTVQGVPAGDKDVVRWSPDGRYIAFSCAPDEDGSRAGANIELWLADLQKGKARSLTAREDYCLMAVTLSDTTEVAFASAFEWAPDSRRLWVQLGWHGETHLASLKVRGGDFHFHTSGHAQHVLGNLSGDGKRLALLVADATHPAELHVADVPPAKELDKEALLKTRVLSELNRELLSELELSRPKAHWVTSTDGAKVQTWTMLPPGASKSRKYPTLVQVHGGPHAQYGWAFFHEFQVLAAAGYAVVFSNPRGSKGYGMAFCDGNSHSWGGLDWADVESVAKDARDRTYCDPKRMGISGGSFGGYMTLWAIGHTRMFKAAVADRCVANMVSMWGASDIYIWPDSYLPGNTWDDTESLWNMSPLKYLGNARTPTLIIHSEGDLRCNVAESEQAYAALSMRGVPTRFVRYPRTTSHGMSRAGPPDMRLHRLGQYLDWWERYLGKKASRKKS